MKHTTAYFLQEMYLRGKLSHQWLNCESLRDYSRDVDKSDEGRSGEAEIPITLIAIAVGGLCSLLSYVQGHRWYMGSCRAGLNSWTDENLLKEYSTETVSHASTLLYP